MRILILIDGVHTDEVFTRLRELLPAGDLNLVLAHVRGPGPRAGLDLLRRRPGGPPGGHRMPPHRMRDLAEAEQESAAAALAEAEKFARSLATTITSRELVGEPGR